MTHRSLAYPVSRSSAVRAAAALALLVLAAACDGPTDPRPDRNPPALVEVVSGDDQKGAASTLLPAPLVLRVRNTSGQPVRNVEVQWTIRSGGGSLSAISSRTDDAGEASVRWTLGPGVGPQAVDSGVLGVKFVTFQATATAAP
ncbi:MAG TPA: Ig-like domain-containing protein [Longimicrobiaceae bacterium]|nr:Ig-like domain-containing protein [Longimicrobiaceae bacterium]